MKTPEEIIENIKEILSKPGTTDDNIEDWMNMFISFDMNSEIVDVITEELCSDDMLKFYDALHFFICDDDDDDDDNTCDSDIDI